MAPPRPCLSTAIPSRHCFSDCFFCDRADKTTRMGAWARGAGSFMEEPFVHIITLCLSLHPMCAQDGMSWKRHRIEGV